MGEDSVTHHGESFTLDEVGIHPRPTRPIPIWMGGGGFESQGHPGEVSMRRAARLADGFKLMAPTGADVEHAIATARRLHELAAEEGRTLAGRGAAPHPAHASGRVGVGRRASIATAGVFTHIGLGNRIVGGTVDDQIALIREVERRVRSEL